MKSINIQAGVECEVTGVKVHRQQIQHLHEELDDLTLVKVGTLQPEFLPLTVNVQKVFVNNYLYLILRQVQNSLHARMQESQMSVARLIGTGHRMNHHL